MITNSDDRNQESPPVIGDNKTNANEVSSTGKSSSPDKILATTALGRPMRRSASKFSAVKLLKAGLPIADDKDSDDTSDLNSKIEYEKDTSEDYVPNEVVSLIARVCVCVLS